jgi:protein TonB
MFSLSRQPEKAHESGGVPLRALGWSLGLHALALSALSGIAFVESGGVAPTEPLRASLRAYPEAVVVAAKPELSAPRQERQTRQSGAVVPVVAAQGAVSPAPNFVEEQAIPREPAGGVTVSRAKQEPVTVALAAPTNQGPDAAGLRQYRLALAGEARRFRSYPEAARREGVAGTAEVRVSVTAGTQRQAELARSSGHAVLDTAALEMLRAAAARALLPDSLRGQEFAVLLPVVFEVEE